MIAGPVRTGSGLQAGSGREHNAGFRVVDEAE